MGDKNYLAFTAHTALFKSSQRDFGGFDYQALRHDSNRKSGKRVFISL